ncbi:hypothetical protein DCC79_02505 [bacterium]|nr:MAG: hypothetical protein DCC79_02505 [bacterium]
MTCAPLSLDGRDWPTPWPARAAAFRLLVVALTDPRSPHPAHAAQACERLLASTSDLQRSGRLDVEFMHDPDLPALRLALRMGGFDGLHILGLPSTSCVPTAVAPEDLVEAVRSTCRGGPGGTPRFALVDPGDAATPDALGSPAAQADQLVAAGVRAAIAIADALPGTARLDIAHAVYRGLADGADARSVADIARRRLSDARFGPAAAKAIAVRVADTDPASAASRSDRPPSAASFAGSDRRVASHRLPGREPVLRELEAACQARECRAVVLHGPAGCGTSTLGAALANRLRARGIVEHVVRVDGGPSLSADGLLQQLLAALGPEHAPELAGALPHPVGLRVKARALLEDATRAPTAVIVDGAERLLVPGGDRAAIDAPSGSAPAMVSQRWVCADDALAHMLASWITSPHPGLILIFTSHVDFDPLAGGAAVAAAGPAASGADGPAASTGGLGRGSSAPPPGDAVAAIRHVAVPPLDFVAAAQAMLDLPALAPLPVRALGAAASMQRVFEVTGGHPWSLSLVARTAGEPVQLGAAAPLHATCGTDSLIEVAVASLAPLARSLLIAASVLDEPVTRAGLRCVAGVESDTAAARRADAEIDRLVAAGLVRARPDRVPADGHAAMIEVPGPVRAWARRHVAARQRPALLRRAGRHWLSLGRAAHDVEAELIGRRYLFRAGDYGAADAVLRAAWAPLLGAGQIERLVRLFSESVSTLTGADQAVALEHLARAYRILGDDTAALRAQEAALEAFESLGDWRRVVGALRELGRLHHDRGAVARARTCVERALMVAEGMRDHRAAADCLLQLGTLHQHHGEYGPATHCLERAIDLARANDDRAHAAVLLTQLAMVHEVGGDTRRAIERYEETLALQSALGDGAAMSATLHQLGLLHAANGTADSARVCYEQACAIAETAGDADRAAMALHQLGLLHLGRGEPGRARPCFEQALALQHGAGTRDGAAGNLFQLGIVDELEARPDDARSRFGEAVRAFEQAGDRPAMVRALNRLARLCEAGGRLDEAVACAARSMVLLNRLGSHDRDAAAGALARLRRKMRPADYDAALQRALDDARHARGTHGAAGPPTTA